MGQIPAVGTHLAGAKPFLWQSSVTASSSGLPVPIILLLREWILRFDALGGRRPLDLRMLLDMFVAVGRSIGRRGDGIHRQWHRADGNRQKPDRKLSHSHLLTFSS